MSIKTGSYSLASTTRGSYFKPLRMKHNFVFGPARTLSSGKREIKSVKLRKNTSIREFSSLRSADHSN
jgi:hypothetical protein